MVELTQALERGRIINCDAPIEVKNEFEKSLQLSKKIKKVNF
jgi:hypothetical protein